MPLVSSWRSGWFWTPLLLIFSSWSCPGILWTVPLPVTLLPVSEASSLVWWHIWLCAIRWCWHATSSSSSFRWSSSLHESAMRLWLWGSWSIIVFLLASGSHIHHHLERCKGILVVNGLWVDPFSWLAVIFGPIDSTFGAVTPSLDLWRGWCCWHHGGLYIWNLFFSFALFLFC